MISDADVARYHEDGYIVVPDVLTPAQLDALRSECDEVVAGASKVTENDACYDLEATHTPERPRVRRIKDPLAVMPSSWEIGKDPRVLSILERLIGPDIRLQKAKLNMKSAEYGAPVEWHQDWAFYPHTNDDLLAIGIALDDCEEENGPLMVIPGSHKSNFAPPKEVLAYEAATDAVVQPVLNKGDVVLFTEASTHGTLPWASDTERRTVLYRFAPSGSAYGRSYLDGLADLDGLSEEQAAVLQPPFHPRLDRTTLDESGAVKLPTPREQHKKDFDLKVFGKPYF